MSVSIAYYAALFLFPSFQITCMEGDLVGSGVFFERDTQRWEEEEDA